MTRMISGELKTQVNLLVPLKWKNKLEDIARRESVKKSRNINIQTLIKEAVSKEYSLS